MGLFLVLACVVSTLFGVTLTVKDNFRYRITPFLGVSLTPQYLRSFLLLKKSSLNSFL